MAVKDISGLALGVTLGGAVFLYSGVTGNNVSATIRGFISGKPPTAQGFATTNTANVFGQSGGSSGSSIVALAQQQLGKKYVWDTPLDKKTANPPSFDCSGLTMWLYWQVAGYTLPHFSGAQYLKLAHRPLASAEAGDLVFYHNGADIYHVAVYTGNGAVIEAPEAGVPVRTRAIKPTDQDIMPNVGVYPGSTAVAVNTSNSGGTSSVAGNKALGQLLATSYGWVGAQWTYLDKLWTRESSWSNTAKNASSGAYGIAQALPESKYPPAGQESGGSSAQAQISWGLAYIKQRYGNPQNAWAHETANGWY